MKMQSSELIRSLLSQNIQLSRENQHIFHYLEKLLATLTELELKGRETNVVALDTLRNVCAEIRLITDAVAVRRLRETGRKDKPSSEELGKIANIDEGIETMYFTVLDHDSLDKLINNFFGEMKNIPHKKGRKKGKNPTDWKFNLGGDLEGEWEDYRNDDPDFPQNPFAGAD